MNPMLPSGIDIRIRENLVEGASRTQTTLIIDPIITLDGHRLDMTDIAGGKGYGKMDQGNAREELLSWTGMTDGGGTYTLTGVEWGINFYNLSSDVANRRRHTSGAKFSINTDMHFIAEQFVAKDEPKASASFVPTDDDDLTTREWVLDNINGGSISINRVVVAATAGETVAANELVYFDETNNEWMKADASVNATVRDVMLGIAQGSGVNGGAISGGVLVSGVASGFTGLTQGDIYYASDTAGAIANTAGTVSIAIGMAKSTTEIYFLPKFNYRELTDNEKAALAGRNTTPSDTNRFITEKGFIKTYEADEDITIGQTVGLSADELGKIARAGRIVTQDTHTPVSALQSLRESDRCTIGGSKFVYLTYNNGGETLYVTAGEIDADTKTLDTGASVSVTADLDGDIYAICKLDTDKFIIFYKEDASTTIVKYRVGTVSGLTITLGSAATFFTAASTYIYLEADYMAVDQGILFVGTQATPANSRFIGFAVSGSTATAGTDLVPTTNCQDSEGIIKRIDTNKFMFTGAKNDTLYSVVGTLAAAPTFVITLGGEDATVPGQAGMSGQYLSAVSPAANVLVVKYPHLTNTAGVIAATISTTTISFGTQLSSIDLLAAEGMICSQSATEILVNNNGSANKSIRRFIRTGNALVDDGMIVQGIGFPGGLIGIEDGYYAVIGLDSQDIFAYVQGMAPYCLGITQNAGLKGEDINVLFMGIDANQSGLAIGEYYVPNNTGGLTIVLSSSNDAIRDYVLSKFFLAISSTEILLLK